MAQAAVMDARSTTQDDQPDTQARLAARRLAAEFSDLALQRLRDGDEKDALALAEWQRYMQQIADGADAGAIAFPAHRPARPS